MTNQTPNSTPSAHESPTPDAIVIPRARLLAARVLAARVLSLRPPPHLLVSFRTPFGNRQLFLL